MSTIHRFLRPLTFNLLLCMALSCKAAQFGDFTYIDRGDYIEIFRYSWSATGSVAIPSTVDGKPVTSIRSYAFRYCRSITSIFIPHTVTSIGHDAFLDCVSITDVFFEGDAPTLHVSPFGGASVFENIHATIYFFSDAHGYGWPTWEGRPVVKLTDLGSSIEVAEYPDESIGEIIIPSNVNGKPISSIGMNAFDGCLEITSIIIPDTVTSLKGSTFAHCWELTSVVIPNSVVSIGDRTFYGCINLVDVTIPSSVTMLGNDSFGICWSLKNVTLPVSITSIPPGIFFQCENLTSIIIPYGVKSIGHGAFWGCASLVDLIVPESVTSIGNGAFNDCSSLTSISLPNNIIAISESTFSSCRNLNNIRIPESVTSIGWSAFDGCTNLTRIVLPDGLTSIGQRAFEECRNLQSINIPRGVTRIEKSTFSFCVSLTNFTLPEGVTFIGGSAFENCSVLEGLIIPASVNAIDRWAFEDCYNLAGLYFLGNAPSVGSDIFKDAPASVYYFSDRTGFTSPTWAGRPTVSMGPSTPGKLWLIENDLAYDADLETDTNNAGTPLFLSYALNLSLDMHDAPQARLNGNQLEYNFYSGRDDVTYTVETSKDLVDWDDTGIVLSAPDGEGYRTASASLGDDVQCFVRVSVAQLP